MKRILKFGLTGAILLSLTACGSGSGEQETNGKQVVSVWSTTEDIEKFEKGFEKENPDIDIKIQVLSNDDYMTKLVNTLKSGQNAPDVFTAESDYVKKLIETDYMDDLSKAPYDFSKEDSGLWDYVVDVGTDSKGTVKALSWQASPGGIIYRTDIAEKVLGISSTDEMSDLLQNNEQILEVAGKLQSQGISMFASWEDLLNVEFSNRSSGWVKDNQLVIDDNLLSFMDLAKELDANKYAMNTTPWDGEWIAGVNNDNCFSYVLPTWGYQYVIKANAEASSGKWGLAKILTPYIKGGTWLGVYSDSDKKEAAWQFMEYVALNEDAQKDFAKGTGDYMSLKNVDTELAAEPGDDILGGQNSYEFYNQLMEEDIPDYITEYDGTINDLFLTATKAYVEGKLDKDEAIDQFKTDVKNSFSNIKVD
ncbi:ABC transporter substrate-binding protein [Enterococcus faecalis]|uniref:ABC transporter substrate-binding protein n=1 Tax=Enterococcus faecalis TaxID=1351 RepID=UPI0015737D12|nr:ABC transporter substrate-binding protein [Enterococcus faecalis]NSW10290.1 carbohydrate ABC transporter substrate-binding protein [Enterococcus faecalis]